MTVDVYVIALVTARLFGVSLLARFGRVRTVQASALLAAIGITLFIVVPSPATAVIGAICWGLGAALGFPVGMSAASDDPIGASARISVVATVGYAGLLVGPPAVGFLAEHVGQLNALFLILVFVIIAGLAAPVLRRPNE
jgi:MFS family permease